MAFTLASGQSPQLQLFGVPLPLRQVLAVAQTSAEPVRAQYAEASQAPPQGDPLLPEPRGFDRPKLQSLEVLPQGPLDFQ